MKIVGLLTLYAACIVVIATASASFFTRNSHQFCRQLNDGTVVTYIFHASHPDSCAVPAFTSAEAIHRYIADHQSALSLDIKLVEIAMNRPTSDEKVYLWSDYSINDGKLRRVLHKDSPYRPGRKITC